MPPKQWSGPNMKPLPDLVANGGKKIPAPDDGATVQKKPPKLAPGLS
jgi:hypothetical protein